MTINWNIADRTGRDHAAIAESLLSDLTGHRSHGEPSSAQMESSADGVDRAAAEPADGPAEGGL